MLQITLQNSREALHSWVEACSPLVVSILILYKAAGWLVIGCEH